jgi:hypothetical protein
MKTRAFVHFASMTAVVAALLSSAAPAEAAPSAQTDDASPPAETVKLIFIHHSTGENWLRDDNGGLGLALAENNYFVSDTNYGWGPDSIGDRTDILNWLEWFNSSASGRYLDALYAENGQNSDYTRDLRDPGGENQIVMFKSCFPNSNLEGDPADPPAPGEALTVSNAKYVYNNLLDYFVTRPDKMFVVITAPPVSDSTFAANARAFNTWLVRDWLRESDYPYANVAVFDFYNVLTGPDNHHRFVDGVVEFVNDQGGDTTYYPSEDDHPSQEGNHKATAEFLPLLNVFYHRWQAGAPQTLPPQTVPTQPEAAVATVPAAGVAAGADLVDDFEAGAPAGTAGWEPFWDEATDTAITCGPAAEAPHTGAGALQIQFAVAPGSWATCALFYDELRDLSYGPRLSLYLRAERAGQLVDFTLYDEAEASYVAALRGTVQWSPVELAWAQFKRADWEEDAGTPFDDPAHIRGIAFGFGADPDGTSTGKLWIDDIQVVSAEPAAADAPTAPALPLPTPEASPSPRVCAALGGLPLALVGLLWTRRRKR